MYILHYTYILHIYIYIYICTYIYFFLYYVSLSLYVKSSWSNFSKKLKLSLVCSYIQKMTLNLIETSKITIAKTKYNQNTKLHFHSSIFLKHPSFSTKLTFIRISVFCLFLCPAFGGPNFLVYIYSYMYILLIYM